MNTTFTATPSRACAKSLVCALQPASYRPHRLHGEDSVWAEKNCYGDLWIGLLHALRFEPMAMLPFTIAVDFEGDQWTFFKPPLSELWDLYRIDVQELTVWRPLMDHAVDHLSAGKLICTEADAFWLPDTAATDYRRRHTKTTIVIARLDVDRETLLYFHNAGFFELSGEDFRGLFGEGVLPISGMPLFAELVRLDRAVHQPAGALAALSMQLLRKHFARRPVINPFARFGERLEDDLRALHTEGLEHYHAWAFATLRQAGAAFELAAHYLRWQAQFGVSKLGAAAPHFDAISQANKALILKGARAVNARRALDADAVVAGMASAWGAGMAAVEAAL